MGLQCYLDIHETSVLIYVRISESAMQSGRSYMHIKSVLLRCSDAFTSAANAYSLMFQALLLYLLYPAHDILYVSCMLPELIRAG
jgi:hypothetical protein